MFVLEEPFCADIHLCPFLTGPAVVTHYLTLLPSVFMAFIALTLSAPWCLALFFVIQFSESFPLLWEIGVWGSGHCLTWPPHPVWESASVGGDSWPSADWPFPSVYSRSLRSDSYCPLKVWGSHYLLLVRPVLERVGNNSSPQAELMLELSSQWPEKYPLLPAAQNSGDDLAGAAHFSLLWIWRDS